ncbi:DoxX family protein [Rhizobium sp. S152]|uniref:DoxX family protein n=1 Tax=Rhizobium sp. S152 TaxID=3055038 RepID=UPI0025A97A3D|nr:DoxX family protein [Rhizobium sp. S152]MDM9627740.1 DoxX family protein [Rhizobium sp. S152]
MKLIEIHRRRVRAGLAVLYLVAGVAHLVLPNQFLKITPGWVPDASMVILLTGICELAGAVGLLWPSTRHYAGIGIALYAACVFPVNIKHAIDSLGGPSPSALQWAYHLTRLPLQPMVVWLALFAGEVISWPFLRRTFER